MKKEIVDIIREASKMGAAEMLKGDVSRIAMQLEQTL